MKGSEIEDFKVMLDLALVLGFYTYICVCMCVLALGLYTCV